MSDRASRAVEHVVACWKVHIIIAFISLLAQNVGRSLDQSAVASHTCVEARVELYGVTCQPTFDHTASGLAAGIREKPSPVAVL